MRRTLEIMYGQAPAGQEKASRGAAIWPYIVLCTGLSVAAVAAVTPIHLAALTLVNVVFGVSAGVGSGFVRKALKVFVLQSVMIVLLYGIRFGFGTGTLQGLTVSWRMALAFTPGFIFMTAVPHHRVAAALSPLLPHRTAFVLGATMTFLPRLLSDVTEIYHAQALRGAKVLPRDMLRPSGWRDAVGCVLVPAIVRAMTLAHEIAQAAEAREFGAHDKRTNWPGE